MSRFSQIPFYKTSLAIKNAASVSLTLPMCILHLRIICRGELKVVGVDAQLADSHIDVFVITF